MGYDSCPPLYNAYGAKILHSKFCKEEKKEKKKDDHIILGNLPLLKKIGLFSRATCPYTHTFRGLFSWATCVYIFKVVYFQGRPAHTLTLILVYFHGRPVQVKKGRVVSL
jgi:hypothetical protein